MAEPNEVLRAAREATPSRVAPGEGMSRREVAEAVNAYLHETTGRTYALDAHYVAKLERGVVRWPTAPYRSALRAVLGAATDGALGFAPPRPQVSLAARPTTEMRAPETDDQNATAPRDAGTPCAGTPDVVAIRAMSEAFRTADRQVGGGRLYPTVLQYLHAEIAPRLLDGPDDPGPALFAAAASVTEIAGWMAHDGGQDRAARAHLGRAYRLATAAEYPALAGNVCASLSHLAGQVGEPAEAVRIADVGLDRTRRAPAAGALTARLYTMRARGLAMHGQARAATTARDAAERTLAAVPDGEPTPDWVAPFDAGSLASEAALVFRALGALAEAERQAAHVVALRDGDRVRARAFGQLTLARVLVDAGRLDEAAALGLAVCAVIPTLSSARVRARLDRLAVALRPHRAVAEVSGFLDCLDLLLPPGAQTAASGPAWPV